MDNPASSATSASDRDERESRDERTIRRLLNLLFAFHIARGPLSTEDIISNPEIGYTGSTHESNVRAFNRDRKTLSEHGIFIQEDRRDSYAKNEQRFWSLDRASTHALPDFITRYDAEAALAAIDQVFSLQNANPAQWALRSARMKLCEIAGVEEASEDLGSQASVSTTQRDALQAIWSSFNDRRTVRFAYRDRAGRERPHDVDLYGMFMRGVSSYIVGLDHEAGAVRTFRTDRITSAKAGAASSKPYRIPDDFDIEAFQFLPFDFSANEPVASSFLFPRGMGEDELASVTKGRGEIEQRQDGSPIWTIDVHDLDAASAFVLEHAACGMRALGPEALTSRVRDSILKAVNAHER